MYTMALESMLIWLIPLMIWDGVWKAIGMWKAGKNNHLAWFICIFVFNTVGILPIIYLAFFQKRKAARKETKKRR